MSYEIEVNLPNRPKGDKVVITGLGEFPNGETSPVDDELVELYRLNNEVRDDDGHVVRSAALGSLNWPEGIKVHRVTKDAKPEAKPEKPEAPVAEVKPAEAQK